MKRRVDRTFIDAWIDKNYPNALAKLSIATGSVLTTSSISKIRAGRVPVSAMKRQRLAEALGVSEDRLFPILTARKKDAS